MVFARSPYGCAKTEKSSQALPIFSGIRCRRHARLCMCSQLHFTSLPAQQVPCWVLCMSSTHPPGSSRLMLPLYHKSARQGRAPPAMVGRRVSCSQSRQPWLRDSTRTALGSPLVGRRHLPVSVPPVFRGGLKGRPGIQCPQDRMPGSPGH